MRPDFYNLRRAELRQLRDEALSLLDQAKTFVNKNGYIVVKFEQNPKLKEALEDIGFFDFHTTNNGYIAGVHQIVLYLHTGIFFFRYRRGSQATYGMMETHHLDSNRQNNDPKNLWYVTPQQNSLCANAVNQLYPGKVKKKHIRSWAKYGGGLYDTAKLVRLTVVRTLNALGFNNNQIPPVINFLMSLPANLGKKIIKTWQFNFPYQ